MSKCTCIAEGEPDFSGHPAGCPASRIDTHKKEDPERAEAVLETIYRGLRDEFDAEAWAGEELRDYLYGFKSFLMDVFRAVRDA